MMVSFLHRLVTPNNSCKAEIRLHVNPCKQSIATTLGNQFNQEQSNVPLPTPASRCTGRKERGTDLVNYSHSERSLLPSVIARRLLTGSG